MNQEIEKIALALFSLILTIPVWFIINLALTPFRVIKEEKDEGQWHGQKFIYHAPKHIQTFLIKPNENNQNLRIKLNTFPPNVFVHFDIEYNRGHGHIIIKNHEQTTIGWHSYNPRGNTYALRLNQKSECVIEKIIDQDSDPTVVKLSALYWEI